MELDVEQLAKEHAKGTLKSHGIQRGSVTDANVSGRDILVSYMANPDCERKLTVCFASKAAAESGLSAIEAYKPEKTVSVTPQYDQSARTARFG